MVRINNVSDGTQNFGVKLYKIDNGDDTLDQVAEADHAPTIVADTMFHISRSQFTVYDPDDDTPPDISAGDLCALSIDPSGTISSTVNGNVYITSVWKIKFDGDERGQGN